MHCESVISENGKNKEKYSRGWRGAPAKGVGRSRGARVQIPLSPFDSKKKIEKNKKSSWQWKRVVINLRSCWDRENERDRKK